MFDFEFANCKNLKIIKTCNFYELLVKKKKRFSKSQTQSKFFLSYGLRARITRRFKWRKCSTELYLAEDQS